MIRPSILRNSTDTPVEWNRSLMSGVKHKFWNGQSKQLGTISQLPRNTIPEKYYLPSPISPKHLERFGEFWTRVFTTTVNTNVRLPVSWGICLGYKYSVSSYEVGVPSMSTLSVISYVDLICHDNWCDE